MAFNSSSINTRYSQSGNIPVLKEDFTKIAADLIAMQTFMKTASSDAGKFTTMSADAVSTGTLTVTSGTSAGAWPANIRLADINTGSAASSSTNGHWNNLTLASGASVPATNITLQHLARVSGTVSGTNAFSFATNFDSTVPASLSVRCINMAFPASTFTGDGGNNIQFYIIGQTTSVSSVPNSNLNLGVCVLPSSQCTGGAGTFHGPVFMYYGFNNTGVPIQFTTVIRVHNVKDQ